jgi:hypothetical protein
LRPLDYTGEYKFGIINLFLGHAMALLASNARKHFEPQQKFEKDDLKKKLLSLFFVVQSKLIKSLFVLPQIFARCQDFGGNPPEPPRTNNASSRQVTVRSCG